MSQHNLQLVEHWFGGGLLPGEQNGEPTCLADDVTYHLVISQPKPRNCSFHGRKAVAEYLQLVRESYQILLAQPRTCLAAGDRVLAYGGDIAVLRWHRQLVRVQWSATVEFASSRIKEVTMSLYRWTVLTRIDGTSVADFVVPDMARIVATNVRFA